MFEVLRNLNNTELNYPSRRKALARKLVKKFYPGTQPSDDPSENLEEAILFLLTEIAKLPTDKRTETALEINEELATMCAEGSRYIEVDICCFISVDDDSQSNWPDLCHVIWLNRLNHIGRS